VSHRWQGVRAGKTLVFNPEIGQVDGPMPFVIPWSGGTRPEFPHCPNQDETELKTSGYIKIYWNSTPYPGGGVSFALGYDPPAVYDYQWSGN
jgi:hypothetical protein